MKEYPVSKNNEYVRFFGRTTNSVLDGITFFNWSCSGFEFEFKGTKACARFFTGKWRNNEVADPENRAFLGVWVDEDPKMNKKIELDEEEKEVILVQDLENKIHKIKVMKLTEAGYGRAGIISISTDGTDSPYPTSAKAVRLEFIGDSITCGYGNICPDASPKFVTKEEDASKTFAYFLSEKLNAQLNCICASGNGVFHDYGMNTVNLIPELYKYADKMLSGHYGKKAEEWDFNNYRPDLIILKLGANDSRYCMGMDLEEEDRTKELLTKRELEFKDRYIAFLKQIRELNQYSKILVFYDSDTYLKKRIEQAVGEYSKEYGDKHIHIANVLSKRPEEGVGANGHWAAATHKRVAEDLFRIIKEKDIL